MISLRQLLIIALVIAGVWLLKRVQQRMLAGRSQPLRRARRNKNGQDYQETVRCGQCGTYLLPADTINDKRYGHRCSDEIACARRAQANADAG